MSLTSSASVERFRELCRRVCREQGWRLNPDGIHVPLDRGRHQVVSIEIFEHEEIEMARLCTTIGEAERLSPARMEAILRLNAELAHGAFGIRGEDFVMVETLVVEDTDAGELEAGIRDLARIADDYEQRIFHSDRH